LEGDADDLPLLDGGLAAVPVGEGVVVPLGDGALLGGVDHPVSREPTPVELPGLVEHDVALAHTTCDRRRQDDVTLAGLDGRGHAVGLDVGQE